MQNSVDQPQSLCTGLLEGKTSHQQITSSDERLFPLLKAGLLYLFRPISTIVPCLHITMHLLHVVAEIITFNHLVKQGLNW